MTERLPYQIADAGDAPLDWAPPLKAEGGHAGSAITLIVTTWLCSSKSSTQGRASDTKDRTN